MSMHSPMQSMTEGSTGPHQPQSWFTLPISEGKRAQFGI